MTNILKIMYSEEVFNYLEYLGYPAMVECYDPEPVAVAISNSIKTMYHNRISPRMAAISIWSLTMTEQIIPQAKKAVKH